MKHDDTDYRALLAAAQRLLDARESQMITADEWEALAAAAHACAEPAPSSDGRDESFSIDALGALVRSVLPRKGSPYQHRCERETFEAIARAIDGYTGPFTLEEIREAACDTPDQIAWTQAAVAFAFLKERGVIVQSCARRHVPARPACAFEDAMIEYHALRDQPAAG